MQFNRVGSAIPVGRSEDLVTGRRVDEAPVERDPSQSPVGSATFPVDRRVAPVQDSLGGARFQIGEVEASVTLTLATGPNDGAHDHTGETAEASRRQ